MRIQETADDYFGQSCSFFCQQNSTDIHLEDQALRVYAYDFEFRSYLWERHCLPGKLIVKPPDWKPECVSSHANTSEVAIFIRDVLSHVPLDGTLPRYISTINFVEKPNTTEYPNAAWLGDPYHQAVFGQCTVNGELRSFAIVKDLVAHEFFHGLAYQTVGNPQRPGLDYLEESGALDESYADIFAILVFNFHNTDIEQWNWEIGRGLIQEDSAIRDLSNPRRYQQPDHWNDPHDSSNHYRELSESEFSDESNDWGWVHYNSGIHNKAAYNLLTSQDAQGKYLLDATSAAKLFYQALRALSNTSTFSDSRRALEKAAKTTLRKARKTLDSSEIARWENIVRAISRAFDSVGIQ